jgi:hypothetical protein
VTPTPPARISNGKVVGPQDAEAALRSYQYTNTLVADLASGGVYTLVGAGYACWIDDSTLLAGDHLFLLDDAPPPVIDLDGACSGLPENRVVPRAGGRVWENPELHTSADGLWTLVQQGDASHITGPGGRTIPVPEASTFSWSPAGHKLAIGGGWCGGEPPLQFIDPDASGASVVTDYPGRSLVYVWRPDSSGVVVGLAYDVGGPSLFFVRASDASASRMFPDVPREQGSPLIPLSVSPSGTRVLFYVYLHRPCPT